MERLKQFQIFYRKGKTDLAMARLAQANPSDEIDNEAILFHLQQAVEKFLKSLLSFHGIATEKTHDIEAIAKKGKASVLNFLCISKNCMICQNMQSKVDMDRFTMILKISIFILRE